MKPLIYSWNKFSEGAKVLSQVTGYKRVKHEGTKRIRTGLVINWGSSSLLPSRISATTVFNSPTAVGAASNKLTAFTKMAEGEVSIPEFTTERAVVEQWVATGLVVCRTILNGHSGAGIVIASAVDEIVQAPLYVKYIKKQEEYRVHVFNGQMIHKQRKARSREVPDEQVNWQVRNHTNGFIFQIEDFQLPDCCKEEAIKAVGALGLDFGAVDVVYNSHLGRAFVLEINTAPGLTQTTAEKYKEAINAYIQDRG